ncbi:hypothetical protein [Streptomyces bauhiniae]|nr:hypothetical protein [Streptomyces bauhiniae]
MCRRCGQVQGLTSRHLTEAAELTGLLPDTSGSLLVYGYYVRCGG